MRTWRRPAVQEVWKAIEAYLRTAYPQRPPSAVRAKLDLLHAMPADEFFESSVFERTGTADAPNRYSLRLGNSFFPHMKLVFEPTPTGEGYMFRVDTHDHHGRPVRGSSEERAFAKLIGENQTIADAVEAAWRSLGIPTFKSYLHEDLDRRSAQRRTDTK